MVRCTDRVEENLGRRVGKGRPCCLGDILECCASHLATRCMALKKSFQITSILDIGGLVWCELEDHLFSEASISQSVYFSIHPFLHIILVLNLYRCMKLNLTAPTTFVFPPFFFFFLNGTDPLTRSWAWLGSALSLLSLFT